MTPRAVDLFIRGAQASWERQRSWEAICMSALAAAQGMDLDPAVLLHGESRDGYDADED